MFRAGTSLRLLSLHGRLAQERRSAALSGCGSLQVPWRRNWAFIKIRETFRWVNINTSGPVTKGLSGC